MPPVPMINQALAKYASLGRRLCVGILSLLVGWLAFFLLIYVVIAVRGNPFHALGLALRIAFRGALVSVPIAIPVHLIFLAIFTFAPRDLFVWRWPIAAVCGAVGGAIAGGLLCLWDGQCFQPLVALFVAIPGIAACLFASLTASWLRDH